MKADCVGSKLQGEPMVQHHCHSLHQWLQVPTLQGSIYPGKSVFRAPTQLSTSLVLSFITGTVFTKFLLFVLGPEQAALGFSAPEGQLHLPREATCFQCCDHSRPRGCAEQPCQREPRVPLAGCEAKQASKTRASALQESICLRARCPFFGLICKLWHSAGRVLCARYRESGETEGVAD